MIRNETLSPKDSLAANGRSFHWASRFLGSTMGNNAARLYAFCRLLDDMADGDIDDGPARLSAIQDDLRSGAKSHDPAFAAFQPLMQELGFSVPVLTALIDGLLDDQADQVLLASEGELLRYAYRVAGTVGLLMCDVLECRDSNAKAHAIDLGIAMQLTNIARDVLEDAHMQRRYIPGEWIGDLEPQAIVAAANAPASDDAKLICAAVQRLIALAETYYQSGARGYCYLPWRAHVGISVAARVYRQIGIQLGAKNYAWHDGRQVTSRMTKAQCSLIAAPSVITRFWAMRPLHETALHHALVGLPYVK